MKMETLFIHLTTSCFGSGSETSLSFFLQNDQLSARGSPEVVLKLSVGRDDVGLHSAMLDDTCTAHRRLIPSSTQFSEEQK